MPETKNFCLPVVDVSQFIVYIYVYMCVCMLYNR